MRKNKETAALRVARLRLAVRAALAITPGIWVLGAQAADTAGADVPAGQQSSSQPLPEVVITAATPLPGTSIDIDRIPGNVQILTSGDINRQGTPSLTGALDSNLGSININDDLDDPFQPDILYRGFEASPVLGTPQGLAVYQNGVRINEAFGDTVNWDLIPDVAINQVELVSSSPLYGLNALGGALSVTMKNGFNYQGADFALSGGSFGQRSVVAEAGGNSGMLGFYVAARGFDSDGWRDFGSDRIRSVYAAATLQGSAGTLELDFAHAANVMNGQGSAPVQELAISPSLVFTGPQQNANHLNFLTLTGTLNLGSSWSAQGVAYYRQYYQSVANGNTTDYTYCANPDGSSNGFLCQSDGATPLVNASGSALPDISQGGSVPIGENDFEYLNAWSRGAALQVSNNDAIFGHDNQFSLGVTLDYAATNYYTGSQIGVISPQLVVEPSDLYVYTTEAAADASGGVASAVPVSVDSVNQTASGFITDTFSVTKDLAVTASGRYNLTHVDLYDQLGTDLNGWNRFVHFNPSIGATWAFSPLATLYGGWSTNTRTPTASEIECSNPLQPCLLPASLASDPPNLSQVISQTYEAGLRGHVKGLLAEDGQLEWNLSLFRTSLHNDIYTIATSLYQGYSANIGDTRRQGIEAGLKYRTSRWSAYLNYSLVQATFQSAFAEPSASPWYPAQYLDANGNLDISPGNRLPGIPENRVKLGVDFDVLPNWSVGATLSAVSSVYYVGDEANDTPTLPGYVVVGLHTHWQPLPHLALFAQINNLLDRQYSTWGILGDPSGIGVPGVPANGPYDPRFQSPAAPFEVTAGVKLTL